MSFVLEGPGVSHEAAGENLGSRVPILIRFCLCVCLEGRAKIWDEMGLAERSGSAAGAFVLCVLVCSSVPTVA